MAAQKKPQAPESGGFLARIDAQIAALQAFREAYLKAVAIGINLAQTGPIFDEGLAGVMHPAGHRAPIELPVGAFRNKSIPEAIKLFLASVRRKQTIRQIAQGLKDGGLESTARNFETTVAGAIYRLQDSGDVLKFKDGWDLALSYPEHIRKSIATDTKPQRKSRKPKRRKRGSASAESVEARNGTTDYPKAV
jgi:hypothetical protein